MFRRLFSAMSAALLVFALGAGTVLAGEVKGPPNQINNTNETGALQQIERLLQGEHEFYEQVFADLTQHSVAALVTDAIVDRFEAVALGHDVVLERAGDRDGDGPAGLRQHRRPHRGPHPVGRDGVRARRQRRRQRAARRPR